jgi:hypothetical protein
MAALSWRAGVKGLDRLAGGSIQNDSGLPQGPARHPRRHRRPHAAMPQLVCMNCRRLRPSRLPLTSANSKIRRSTRFCVSLCGGGRYSPFDTICVGIGVAAEAASAPATRRCSRSLSQLLIVVLPGSVCDHWSLDLSIAPNNVRMVCLRNDALRAFLTRATEAAGLV